MGRHENRFREAAAECLAAAEATADLQARAALLRMAQKWIELADERVFNQRRLDVALDHFNTGQLYISLDGKPQEHAAPAKDWRR